MARILATDDRPDILALVDRSLGGAHECVRAESVAEARERLREETFQLALCDIQMPGESGLVLAEEVIGSEADTAVVLITGEDDPEVARRAFEIGVHGYLVKPFWPGQLRITVMSALLRIELEVAAREHTRNQDERIQKFLDMAPVPIYVKDRSRRYVLSNPPADELAGVSRGEIVGKRDEDLMSPEDANRHREADRMVLHDGITYGGVDTVDIGGAERTFSTVKFPFLDESGEVAAICGISIDITGQKDAERLQAELTEAQSDAIEELRASRQETVERLVRAIEIHDPSTGEHVGRMASVAAHLGERMGLSSEGVELLRVAAPMHDVGKIATPDEILRKPGGLTDEERREMERHTLSGTRSSPTPTARCCTWRRRSPSPITSASTGPAIPGA